MSILNLFPMPKYLELPAFGFDLSDRSLKYIELVRARRGFFSGRFGEKIIPQGLIEDGEIRNKEGLISLLRQLQEELKLEYIIAALPEEKVFLSTIQLPTMEPEEIAVALESQLEENVPLAPSEIIFDYEVLPETVKDEHLDVNLVAAPRQLVESYQQVFEGAGFQPIAFDLESRALVRALISQRDKAAQMIVDFGKVSTNFIIVSNEKVRFTSMIKVAGKSVDEAIARALSVSLQEAEQLKKQKGVIRLGEEGEIFSAILPVISAISEQITRHLSYWDSHPDEHGKPRPKIEKIILSGGDSNLPGLTDYLAYRIGLPVEYGNAWLNIASFDNYLPEIEFKDSLRYATALGLALRERL